MMTSLSERTTYGAQHFTHRSGGLSKWARWGRGIGEGDAAQVRSLALTSFRA